MLSTGTRRQIGQFRELESSSESFVLGLGQGRYSSPRIFTPAPPDLDDKPEPRLSRKSETGPSFESQPIEPFLSLIEFDIMWLVD